MVEPEQAIDFAYGRMPAVLCIPWLIWFLEHAAREAIPPFLAPGESTGHPEWIMHGLETRDHGEQEQTGQVLPACCLSGWLSG